MAFLHAFKKVFAIMAAGALTLTAAACGSASSNQTSDSSAESGPITVVASINQWGLLASEIGGNKVQVTSILGSTNVDAHDFEPQTSDIAKIAKADVLVANGAGYDEWAIKAAGKNVNRVTASTAVGASDGDNPHLWFSKDARKSMAQELTETFSKARPSDKDYFAKQYQNWQEDEDELDQRMQEFKSDHPHATYAAIESVAYYLMSDLDMTDKTPTNYAQAAANESEPAPADVRSFQQILEDRTADLLINNSQESSDMTNMITGTAQKADVPVINVTEQVPEKQTRLTSWMNALIDEFEQALDQNATDQSSDTSDTSDSGSVSDNQTDSGK